MKKTGFNEYVYDFSVGLTILSDFTNANLLSCISMNNQKCKTRPQFINVNGDGPLLFSI